MARRTGSNDVFDAVVIPGYAPDGWENGRSYALQNLTPNAQDVFSCRVVFTHPVDLALGIIVKIAPKETVQGIKGRRRDGRPECGFQVAAAGSAPIPAATFIPGPWWTLVTGPAGGVVAIYFTIENNSIEPTKWEAPDTLPKWEIGFNNSGKLAEMYPKQWVSLDDIHPDPEVNPGIPINRQPQRNIQWGRHRSACSNLSVLGGKWGGSIWASALGFYPEEGLRNTSFKGNHYTRFGRLKEPHIMIANLEAVTNNMHGFGDRVYYETGWWDHPTIPDCGASPDCLIKDPRRTWDTLPVWYRKEMEAWVRQNPGSIDLASIDFSIGVGEAKERRFDNDKKEGPRMEAKYLPQIYAEMICTNTWWSELTRNCDQTGETRLYRIYRKPRLVKMIETQIIRVRDAMLGGATYEEAICSPETERLQKFFHQLCAFYNSPTEKKRYYNLSSPTGQRVQEFEDARVRGDIIAHDPDDPSISPINARATPGKPSKAKPKRRPVVKKKKKKERVIPTQKRAAAPVHAPDEVMAPSPEKRTMTDRYVSIHRGVLDPDGPMATWLDIDECHLHMRRLAEDKKWDTVVRQADARKQMLRYAELLRRISVKLAMETNAANGGAK